MEECSKYAVSHTAIYYMQLSSRSTWNGLQIQILYCSNSHLSGICAIFTRNQTLIGYHYNHSNLAARVTMETHLYCFLGSSNLSRYLKGSIHNGSSHPFKPPSALSIWHQISVSVFRLKPCYLLCIRQLMKADYTLMVINPSGVESHISRSMSWLLMTWRLVSPGHQQSWHWQYGINGPLSSIRNDYNQLHHLSVEKWWELQIYIHLLKIIQHIKG